MNTQETKIELSEDFFNEKSGRWESRKIFVAPTQEFWLQFAYSEEGVRTSLHKLWVRWLKEQNSLDFLEDGEFEDKIENPEELEFFESFEEFCEGRGRTGVLEETCIFVNSIPEEEKAKEQKFHGEEEE